MQVMATTKPEELNSPMMMIVAVADMGPRGMKVKDRIKKQGGKKDKEGKNDKGGEEHTSNAKTIGVPMGGYPMCTQQSGIHITNNSRTCRR